jgi:hypothetical protein
MRGTWSPESRVDSGLRQFKCSGKAFVELAKASGIQIAYSTFALILSDRGTDFTADTAARLLDLLEQMRLLQTDVDVPVDWSRSELVSRALAVRRLSRIAHEDGGDGDVSPLDSYAKALTSDVAGLGAGK